MYTGNSEDHEKGELDISNNNSENNMPVKYFSFNSLIEIEQILTFMWLLLVLGCHKWSSVPHKAPADP